MKKTAYFIAILLSGALAFTATGCRKKGPAENVGESLDKAGENIKDAVTPDGPAEKAGKKVDKAADDVKDKVKD
jgi:hypothetical protein